MINSLESRNIKIDGVTYTPINSPVGVTGQTTVQQIYKSTADDKFYIIAEGGTPEELGGGGGGTKITGSLPTSGWNSITPIIAGEFGASGRYDFRQLAGFNNTELYNSPENFEVSYFVDTWTQLSKAKATLDTDKNLYYRMYENYTAYIRWRIYENGTLYYKGSSYNNRGHCYGIRRANGIPSYTITNSAIKTNSFIQMFLTDDGDIKQYSKTDESLTITRDTVPVTAIPYELQIIETDSESAFWIKNTYVPTKTSQLENDSNFLNEGFYYIDCSATAINLNDYLSDDFVGVYVLDKATSSNVSNLPSDYTGTNTVIMTRRKFADGGVSQTIEWSYGTTEIIDYKYARTPQSTAWQRMRATADVLSITIPYANFVTIAGFEPFTKYCLVTVDTKYNAGAEYELIANTLITIFATYGIALYNVEQNPSDATKTDFYFLAITAPITDMQVTVKVNYSDSLDYDA